MGVYIKGMKMPKDCNTCHINNCLLPYSKGVPIGHRHKDCPLIEIEEPHGRLIDADVAQDRLLNIMCGTGYQSRAISAVRYEYMTPTIIESEE